MSAMIAKLAKGDRVHSRTASGVVAGFERDRVLIRWSDRIEVARYTDEGLQAHGVRLVGESR